jgi:hypothetical protein
LRRINCSVEKFTKGPPEENERKDGYMKKALLYAATVFLLPVLSNCSNYDSKKINLCNDDSTLYIIKKYVYENGHLSSEEIDYIHNEQPKCFHFSGRYTMAWNFPSSKNKLFSSNKYLHVSFCLNPDNSIDESSLSFELHIYGKQE